MIKEEYKNISDDEFVPLIYGSRDGIIRYKINKKGEILTISTNNIRKTYSLDNSGYPIVGILVENSQTRSMKVHLLVANTFLVRESFDLEVDHISRDKSDYSLSNLRFVTKSVNLGNTDRSNAMWNKTFKKYDKDMNFIEIVSYLDFTSEERIKLTGSYIKSHKLYKGFYYDYGLSKELYDYLDYIGLQEEDLDSLEFIEVKNPELKGVLVSKEGIIKWKGKYTIGSVYGEYRRFMPTRRSKTYSIHRLVYETFNNITLNPEDVIDHINTYKFDNRLINLKLTDSSGNMKNPITLEKKSKIVLQYDLFGNLLKTYKSLREASETLKVDLSSAVRNGFISNDSIWIYKDQDNFDEELRIRLDNATKYWINQYTKDGEFIKTFKSLSDIERILHIDSRTIKRMINNPLNKDKYIFKRYNKEK